MQTPFELMFFYFIIMSAIRKQQSKPYAINKPTPCRIPLKILLLSTNFDTNFTVTRCYDSDAGRT